MFAKLIVTKKSDPEWLLERVFEQEVISLGRDRSNSIRLADDTKYISRHHCELIRDVEVYRLIDPGSLNQTLLNDVQIAENIPYALRSGDIITIGDYMIKFLYVEEPEVEDAKSEGEIEYEFEEDIIGLARWLKRLQRKSRGEDRTFRKELLHNAFSMALNDPDITEFGEIFEDVIRDIASNSHPALQEASEPSLPAFEPGSLDAMEDPTEIASEADAYAEHDDQDEITLDNLPNIEEDITLDGIDISEINDPSGSLEELDAQPEVAPPVNKENRGTDPSNDFGDLTFPEDITDEGLVGLPDDSSDDSSESETKEPSRSDSTTEEVRDDSDTELQVDPKDKVKRIFHDETSDESDDIIDLDSDQSIFIEPEQSVTFERIPDQDIDNTFDNSITFEDPDKSITFEDPDKSISIDDPDKSITFEDPDKSISIDDPDKSITFEDPDKSLFIEEEPDKSISIDDPDKSLIIEDDPDKSITFEDPDRSLFVEEDPDKSINVEPDEPEDSAKDVSEEVKFKINSPDDTLNIPEGFQDSVFRRSYDETHDDLLNSEYANLKTGDSSNEITFSDEMTNEHVIPAPDATEEDVTPLTLEGQLPKTPRTEIIIIDEPVEPQPNKAESEDVNVEQKEEIDEEESAIDNQLFDEDDDTFETIKNMSRKSAEVQPPTEAQETPAAEHVPDSDDQQHDEFAFSAETTPIEPELSQEDTWINLDDAITEEPISPPVSNVPLLDQMEDPKTETVEIRLTESEASEDQIDVEVIYTDSEESVAVSDGTIDDHEQPPLTDEPQETVEEVPEQPTHTGHRSRRGQDVRITDPYEIARNLGKEQSTNGNGKSLEAMKMLIDVLLETYRTTEEFRRDFIKLSLPEQGSFGSSTPEQLQAYLFDPSISEEESLVRLRKLRKKFDDLNTHHQAIMDGYWASITEGREIILENIDLQRIRQEIGNQYFHFAGIRIPQRFIPLYVKKKAYRTLETRVNTLITENRQNFQKKVFWPSFVRAYTKRLNRRKSAKKKRDYQS